MEASVNNFYKSSKKTPTRIFPIFDPKNRKSVAVTPTTSSAKKRKSSFGRSPPSSVAAKKNRKRKLPLIESNKQYAIDAGQKNFDASTCKKCQMVFTEGEFTDMEAHEKYCSNYDKAKRWTVTKTEKQRDFLASYITKDKEFEFLALPILPDDSEKILKKVDNLFTLADRELNINMGLFECKKPSSMYIVALADGLRRKSSVYTPSGDEKRKSETFRVAGFVAAEGIKAAYRLISDNPLSHSTESEPAILGVSRIWVHKDFRRKRVAAFLLETLRKQYMAQMMMDKPRVIERREIAFTDPTSEGLLFAQRFTGLKHFLVFTFQLEECLATATSQDSGRSSDNSNGSE
jgi:N-acetyltransferase